MKVEIEIPDEELKDVITQVIAKKLCADYSADRTLYKRTIAECVREVIYADKENIVNKVVAQASRECRTKAIKKLLDFEKEMK